MEYTEWRSSTSPFVFYACISVCSSLLIWNIHYHTADVCVYTAHINTQFVNFGCNITTYDACHPNGQHHDIVVINGMFAVCSQF